MLRSERAVRVEVRGEDPLAVAGLSTLLRAVGLSVGDPLDPLAPEVLIVDGVLPVSPQSEAAVPSLVLVEDLEGAREALAAGASGVIRRSRDAAAVAAAVQAVAQGFTVSEPGFFPSLPPPDHPRRVTDLTPRELDVLALLAEGLSNADIAKRLGVRPNTAKFHVQAILDKLGATTRTEAVVLAARDGLVYL